jgi:hypothetical protein
MMHLLKVGSPLSYVSPHLKLTVEEEECKVKASHQHIIVWSCVSIQLTEACMGGCKLTALQMKGL